VADPHRSTDTSTTGSKSPVATLQELVQLVVAYFKQETVEPVKGLARFVAAGVAGSFLLGIGLVLIVVGGLRALQTETDNHLTGHLSWVPYAIALVFCALVAAIAVKRATRKKGSRP
jgi:ABC-type Mn2+/Zn2+ transport system permease subunit